MDGRTRRRDVAVAGTGDDDELGEGEDVAVAVPLVNFGESVGADDEVEIRGEGPKFFDGEDGVTLFGPFFEARRNETRVGVAGQFDHAVAVFEALAAEVVLVRRMSGGDEKDPVEGKSAGGLACDGDVSEMDGIEGAAEDGKRGRQER